MAEYQLKKRLVFKVKKEGIKVCPDCYRELPDGTVTCDCGKTFKSKSEILEEQERNYRRSRLIKFMTGGGIIILLGLAVAGLIYVNT